MDENFSWRTGLKHAGLGVLFVSLLGLVSFALIYDEVRDPYRLGEGVGRFAAFSGMGALGVSWCWQTGRAGLAKGLMALWSTLVLLLAVFVTMTLINR